MLCDEIATDQQLRVGYPGFNRVQERLYEAHKYMLAPDFAAAADGLLDNFKELERIAPFCRLPAPVCWFEIVHANRPHFMEAPMHFGHVQSRPGRIAFLCELLDPVKPWEWLTTLLWSFPEVRDNDKVGPHNVSIVQVQFNTKDGYDALSMLTRAEFVQSPELARLIQLYVAPFSPPEALYLMKHHNSQFVDLMRSDWGGEIRYLFAVLGLLNARNVAEVEQVDKAEHNKKRARQGRPPLFSHSILKIRAMHRRSFLGKRGQGTGEDIRHHFVSGHWKARRSGLFWWNPHWRGSTEKGEVTHDYVVKT